MNLPDWMEPLGPGLFAIDTGFQRPRFDAAYLVVDDSRAAFIDTGTNRAVPRLLGALEALGLSPAAVDWVLPTHVHLDHAGGCGLLLASLPAARLRVHPRDARHLIDPSALFASALAVYGEEEMARSYGTLVPVPAERIDPAGDGHDVRVGSRLLVAAETPGHARHHVCYWDERSRGWFSGDTFGVSYRELDVDGRAWIHPATTPTQFDPQALKASIGRLMQRDPQIVYLTHYAGVTDPRRLARQLIALIDAMVALARSMPAGAQRHGQLVEALARMTIDSLRRHGSPHDDATIRSLLGMDLELNAQGLGIWLDRSMR